MYGPVKKLSRVNASIQQAIAASERVFEILDTHNERHDRIGRDDRWRKLRDAITFAQRQLLPTAMATPRRCLRDVSFTVRVGQVVAIVGLSVAPARRRS